MSTFCARWPGNKISEMKSVKMSPIGSEPEDHGYSAFDLLEQMPSVMLIITSVSTFPSLSLLNNIFSKGELDSGMSGGVCWEKFEISNYDLEELKKEVSKKYNVEFKGNPELDSLSSYSEWASKALKYCRSGN